MFGGSAPHAGCRQFRSAGLGGVCFGYRRGDCGYSAKAISPVTVAPDRDHD